MKKRNTITRKQAEKLMRIVGSIDMSKYAGIAEVSYCTFKKDEEGELHEAHLDEAEIFCLDVIGSNESDRWEPAALDVGEMLDKLLRRVRLSWDFQREGAKWCDIDSVDGPGMSYYFEIV